MNNLLRTLTQSHSYENDDKEELRLLLSTVKEQRNKNLDPKQPNDTAFYDSLDEVLNDMKSVTMDNHDADAFLRPVTKSEVPDYGEYIKEPMDLQTMTRKVKLRQYKSKREFKDDLDLIWTNCWTYNMMPDHPLRKCASRLKVKADNLLKHVTDRKERIEPFIPGDLPAGSSAGSTSFRIRLPVNGHPVNGKREKDDNRVMTAKGALGEHEYKRYTTWAKFEDTPAIERTAEGMRDYQLIEQNWRFADDDGGDMKDEDDKVGVLLRALLEEDEDNDEDGMDVDEGAGSGDKRKQNGTHTPRKRPRLAGPDGDADMISEALQTDYLIANGLPHIAQSSYLPPRPRKRKQKSNPPTSSEVSLLTKMNRNIATLQRIRKTHSQLAAMIQDKEEGGSGSLDYKPPLLDPPKVNEGTNSDWTRPLTLSGIEVGEKIAKDCVGWMSGKVLEHVGFQGTSKSAMDALSCLAEEYLYNVGRTLKFMSDQYGKNMTAEEIVMHTLFESGVAKIQDLEGYIQDDIVRYGIRLEDLDKKMTTAYADVSTAFVLNDDAMFDEEEGEDDGAFVMGGFADAFGEDFLGLKELGIADEHGLASLSVPRRLLKGRRRNDAKGASGSHKQPALPYPPPHSYQFLDSNSIGQQIGLLQNYYKGRVAALVPTPPPAPATLPPSLPPATTVMSLPSYQLPSYAPPGAPQPAPPVYTLPSAPATSAPPLAPPAPVQQSQPPAVQELIVLPDDLPDPSRVKISTIGAVIKPSMGSAAGGAGGGGSSRKKTKKDTSVGREIHGIKTEPSGVSTNPITPRKPSFVGSAPKKGLGIGLGGQIGGMQNSAPPNVPPPIIAAG